MICERTIRSSTRRCLRYLAKVNSGNIASYLSTRGTTQDWRILWQARKGKCSTRACSKHCEIKTYRLVVMKQVGKFCISFFQQFPWFSDLSRLGDDIHHDIVVHLNDVRDSAKARDGHTGIANHRILLRYLYEHRTGAKDPGGRSVLHTQGLHQRCCFCVRCLYLYCTSNMLGILNSTLLRNISFNLNKFNNYVW